MLITVVVVVIIAIRKRSVDARRAEINVRPTTDDPSVFRLPHRRLSFVAASQDAKGLTLRPQKTMRPHDAIVTDELRRFFFSMAGWLAVLTGGLFFFVQ